jgi:hypothetical protein
MGDCTGEWSTKVRSQYLTRNTKELDHERLLVSVILDSLSERHWLFIYMEIVARRTPVVQKLLAQIFISLIAMENMSLIHPWNAPWNKDCLWRTTAGEISYRTESTKLLIAFFDLPIGIVAAVLVVVPCPGSTVYIRTDYGGSTSCLPSGGQPTHPRPSSPFWGSNARSYLSVTQSLIIVVPLHLLSD